MTTLILLVFLQGHDAGTPLGAALVHAAEQALGPGASVVVRSSGDAEISDAASLQAGRAEKAFAVARVSWRSPSLRDSRVGQARVVLTILETGRSAAQTLSFDNADLPVERGRAIGLVLAAMAQPERAAPAAAPSPDKPVAVAPASPPAAGTSKPRH